MLHNRVFKLKTRLPPGQQAIDRIQHLHIGAITNFDPKVWKLTVDGAVEKPFVLRWSEVLALPRITLVADFHCVEGWSVLDNKWEGVAFKTIVEKALPKPEVKSVFFSCNDGYTTSLLLSDLLENDILLAYRLNEKPLELELGAPLRLIVPKKYAYKSAMWIQKITFSIRHVLGYWELRGYSDTADPWTQDRYAK